MSFGLFRNGSFAGNQAPRVVKYETELVIGTGFDLLFMRKMCILAAGGTKMKAIVLGSGSAYATPQAGGYWGAADAGNPKNRRTRASFLYSDGAFNLLIDAGPDIAWQLTDNAVARVDAVFFTHAHADHINGIPDLQRLAFNQKAPISVFCAPETLDGIRNSFDFMFSSRHNERGSDLLRWHTAEKSFEICGRNFEIFPLPHKYMNSYALKIGSFLYATDFDALPEDKAPFFEQLDCLVMETNNGFNFDAKGNGHNDFGDAFRIKERFGPKRMILTHLGIDIDYETDMRKMPDGIELAYDGMNL